MLSHLLHLHGIESVVIETRSRAYVEQRVRAGVLEHGTAELLEQTGVDTRMRREGLVHHGIALRFLGQDHRIDMTELTGGRSITVYGQQEVVKDLITARLSAGGVILFDVDDVVTHDVTSQLPMLSFTHAGERVELRCDYIAGCDGFHGVCRAAIPEAVQNVYERVYPYAWLGILARAKPASDELIYSYHPRGFALLSMRSTEISRLYLQVPPDEALSDWSDDRIWQELHRRLDTERGFALHEGPILERGVTGMRSFVVEPMQYGRLFLAGDAAHIVPPTGAKGMNLAIADVFALSRALSAFYRGQGSTALENYSATALARVWRAEHFSWWMTSMLHQLPDGDPFQQKLQLAQLSYVVSSRAAATSLAENYVGLPLV
jgi:p-hydroxybenzoate 3-monooxygenase